MTRDEAIKKLGLTIQYPGDFVDGLCVFGLLTLDEPKSGEDRLRELIKDYTLMSPDLVFNTISALGLKIVEKDKP